MARSLRAVRTRSDCAACLSRNYKDLAGKSVGLAPTQSTLCFVVLAFEARDELRCRNHFVHGADALSGAPNIFPRFGFGRATAEIHLGRITLFEIGRIKTGGDDRP